MKFERKLQLNDIIEKNSFFFFGPRATGKSFLIRHTFGSDIIVINLLRAVTQLRLLQNPSELEEMILGHPSKGKPFIVIYEVQKIPILLDEVHRLIEERGWKFLLTGSSARRLKAEGANLLAGRAWIVELFPLSFCELPDFDLDRYPIWRPSSRRAQL